MIGDVHTADVHTIIPIIVGDELVGWAAACHPRDRSWAASSPARCAMATPTATATGSSSLSELWARMTSSTRTISALPRGRPGGNVPCSMRRPACRLPDGARAGRYAHRRGGLDTFKAFMREAIEEGRLQLARSRQMLVPGVYGARASPTCRGPRTPTSIGSRARTR